jgi:hypothetical protein
LLSLENLNLSSHLGRDITGREEGKQEEGRGTSMVLLKRFESFRSTASPKRTERAQPTRKLPSEGLCVVSSSVCFAEAPKAQERRTERATSRGREEGRESSRFAGSYSVGGRAFVSRRKIT